MSTTSTLTPRSALRHRPINPGKKTIKQPEVRRASRTTENVPTFVRLAPPQKTELASPRVGLVSIGIGMMLALLAVLLGQMLLGWFSTTWDDLHYGRPRTFQTDAFVGHETGATPSHFIALNLHGRVEIIELPGGDPTHAKIYVGPQIYGSNADLTPVTLQFSDPKHTHHPDMILLFQNTQVVFRNEQGTFHLEQS